MAPAKAHISSFYVLVAAIFVSLSAYPLVFWSPHPLELTKIVEVEPDFWMAEVWSKGDNFRIGIMFRSNQPPRVFDLWDVGLPDSEDIAYTLTFITALQARKNNEADKVAKYRKLIDLRLTRAIKTNDQQMQLIYGDWKN
jgi:hypothetical protein